VEFVVLEAISNVQVSELLGSLLVEETEASPHQRPNHYSFAASRLLDCPASLGLVSCESVEEIVLEGGFWSIESCFEGFVLDISKMLV
jgi:hypothetical protein